MKMMIAKEIDRNLGYHHFGSAKVVIFLAVSIEYASLLSYSVATWLWKIWVAREVSHHGCTASRRGKNHWLEVWLADQGSSIFFLLDPWQDLSAA